MKKVYLIAVVFALVAGFATYMFANQLAKNSTIKDADTVAVAFAMQDIPKNTIISEEMVVEDAGYFSVKKDVIAADATPLPINDLSKLVGQVVAVDIYAGEQLNEHKFVGADSDEVGLSYKLSPGMVAYSFTAGSTNGVDGYISPGDTVDILTYETGDDGEVKTKTAYSNLRILRVSDASSQKTDGAITSYSTLTVEITEKQSHEINNIIKGKAYTLVLNSRQDTQNGAATEQEATSQEATSQAPQN